MAVVTMKGGPSEFKHRFEPGATGALNIPPEDEAARCTHAVALNQLLEVWLPRKLAACDVNVALLRHLAPAP